MAKVIIAPAEALAIIANGGHYELGVYPATKAGFKEYIAWIELALIVDDSDQPKACWVCRDEICDTVDFISADEADQEIAAGYEGGSDNRWSFSDV